jgi:hypothetical protein
VKRFKEIKPTPKKKTKTLAFKLGGGFRKPSIFVVY